MPTSILPKLKVSWRRSRKPAKVNDIASVKVPVVVVSLPDGYCFYTSHSTKTT